MMYNCGPSGSKAKHIESGISPLQVIDLCELGITIITKASKEVVMGQY